MILSVDWRGKKETKNISTEHLFFQRLWRSEGRYQQGAKKGQEEPSQCIALGQTLGPSVSCELSEPAQGNFVLLSLGCIWSQNCIAGLSLSFIDCNGDSCMQGSNMSLHGDVPICKAKPQ